MQLLIILALLLYGGKSGTKNIMEEVKPVLETFGGEEIKEALKSAEEISGMLTAVQGLAGSGLFGGGDGAAEPAAQGFSDGNFNSGNPDDFFPLAPIAAIADKDITYSLSKYIATAN